MRSAAALINQAKKPYLLAGHGISIANAEEELLNFAEKTSIPVACTLHGLSAFPTDHHLYVGMLGMHGNYGANILTNEADLIIAVGMRFDDRVTGNLDSYARQAKIIHIEIDPAEINKNVHADIALLADAKYALRELINHIQPKKHESWLKKFKSCYEKEYEKVISNEIYPADGKIKMAEVVHLLSNKTQGQAILVSDVGQHQMIAARYYQFKQNNSHVTRVVSVRWVLHCLLLLVKLAMMDREVIAIIGDEDFK